MQNRNFIKVFAILFAIVSLYQLSFTWVAGGVEDDAIAYASNYPEEQQEEKERFLDNIETDDPQLQRELDRLKKDFIGRREDIREKHQRERHIFLI